MVLGGGSLHASSFLRRRRAGLTGIRNFATPTLSFIGDFGGSSPRNLLLLEHHLDLDAPKRRQGRGLLSEAAYIET